MAQRCGGSNYVEFTTSNKTPRIYSHIVVLCCVRSVIVVLVLEQATHHGARTWFGVACARRYMTMASDGAPSPVASPMMWLLVTKGCPPTHRYWPWRWIRGFL